MEMSARLLWFGAPKLYATWKDEGKNGVLKDVGQKAHRTVWHARVLTEMATLMSSEIPAPAILPSERGRGRGRRGRGRGR
jgi:hypothetical protein